MLEYTLEYTTLYGIQQNFINKKFGKMILKQLNKLARLTTVANVREYSYKPIKRPDFNSPKTKAVIDKKFKELNLSQILKARIELTGPLTGETSEILKRTLL
jgi:hypothetical protein